MAVRSEKDGEMVIRKFVSRTESCYFLKRAKMGINWWYSSRNHVGFHTQLRRAPGREMLRRKSLKIQRRRIVDIPVRHPRAPGDAGRRPTEGNGRGTSVGGNGAVACFRGDPSRDRLKSSDPRKEGEHIRE